MLWGHYSDQRQRTPLPESPRRSLGAGGSGGQNPFTDEGFLLRERATYSRPRRPVAHFSKVLHNPLHIFPHILAF